MTNLIQKKAAKVGLDASFKTSIVPDDEIIDLRNLVRDYYYVKDLQSSVVLKLNAELKVSFPAYLQVFSKITTLVSLKLLETYPLAADMLSAPKDEIIKIIRKTTRFGEKYALSKYDAICDAAEDAAVFGQICLIQSLRGVGFLSAVILIAEMGSFDLFSSTKKLYAYFGLDPGVNDSGKFHGDRVHMSKRGSSFARRILHMITINNLKVDKGTKAPVNPVIYDYYIRKCSNKKKIVAVGAIMHKICNIIFAVLRDNKPFELITPEKHCERYAAEHPESVNTAA